jgi:hypothetical protein
MTTDEMLAVQRLFECWKHGVDGSSTINEALGEVIETFTIQCVGIHDPELLDSELWDSQFGMHATMDSLYGIGVGFCDFYNGTPQ